jgi:hypothetical protein
VAFFLLNLHCRGIFAFFLLNLHCRGIFAMQICHDNANLKGKTQKCHNANLKGKMQKCHINANLEGKTPQQFVAFFPFKFAL